MKRGFIYFNRIFTFPFIIRWLVKRIEGIENIPLKGNFILAPSHQSSLDHWLILFLLNKIMKKVRFLGGKEGLKGFLRANILYYLSNTVVVDRNNPSREKIMAKLQELLNDNKIVVIYPEGNANKGKELLRGKTGVAELSLRSGAPVVPLGIRKAENSFKNIIKVGKPMYFEEEKKLVEKTAKDSEEYYSLLRKITDNIMREISKLSGKPYIYGN